VKFFIRHPNAYLSWTGGETDQNRFAEIGVKEGKDPVRLVKEENVSQHRHNDGDDHRQQLGTIPVLLVGALVCGIEDRA
jgi:hypothetical protein